MSATEQLAATDTQGEIGAGAVDVIKVGGRAQEDGSLVARLVERWNAAPGSFCVVHGGAAEIDRLQRRLGGTPTFVNGRRVTTDDDIEIVRMALSATANKRLVSALCAAGVPAVGISGEDGSLLRASPAADTSLGRVGSPAEVRASLLRVLLAGGFLPVVAPLGTSTGPEGGTLNVNGDDAGAAIAVAMGAGELLFVTDVPGVRRASATVPSLAAHEALAMIAAGDATGGMLVKIEGALAALGRGVARVRIGDVASISDASMGTTLYLRED